MKQAADRGGLFICECRTCHSLPTEPVAGSTVGKPLMKSVYQYFEPIENHGC
jgi:hypothetical protein